MSDKVACKECGALILATTAERTADRACRVRKASAKEEGKRWHEERKKVLANPNPAAKHWRWLVEQVHRTSAGCDGLSDANKFYFAAVLLEGEIHNGGFDQYFHDGSADYFSHAIRGLEEMEATLQSRRAGRRTCIVRCGDRSQPRRQDFIWSPGADPLEQRPTRPRDCRLRRGSAHRSRLRRSAQQPRYRQAG